jgi:hypothetical protein
MWQKGDGEKKKSYYIKRPPFASNKSKGKKKRKKRNNSGAFGDSHGAIQKGKEVRGRKKEAEFCWETLGFCGG